MSDGLRNSDGVPYFNEDGSANPAAGSPFTPSRPLIDLGQGPTLEKFRELGSWDTWAGAGKAAVGIDPKAPKGSAAPTEEDLEPALHPGGGTHLESLDQGNQGAADVAGSKQMMLGGGGMGQGPSAFYRKEGTSSTSVGGPNPVTAAFETGPAALEDAYRQANKAHVDRTGALGKHYDQVAQDDAQRAAAFASRRAEEQASMELRQKRLEDATTYYSNDLADTGKFWQNPGNIIAAISYSLLPIFGGDPTAGVRLVQQAVAQDMATRQHAANATLGALQSNISGYHKIAGDRQQGDLLAQAEAHRMAAQEAERIGQKFESAQSKAQLEAIVQDQRIKQAKAWMDFHKSNLYVPAAKMEKGLFDARAQGVPGAYAPMGQGSDTPNPYSKVPGAASVGQIAGTPSVASDKKNSGFSSDVRPATIAAIKVGGGKAAWAEALNGHIPGQGNLFNAADMELNAKAAALAKGNPAEFMAHKAALMDKAEAAIKDVAPVLDKVAGRNAALSMLQERMEIVRRMEAQAGRPPDRFMDDMHGYLPDSWVQKWNDVSRRWASEPATRSAQQAALRNKMREQLRTDIASVYNNYVHEHSGGAVSDSERAKMNNVIRDGMSLGELEHFVQGQSVAANAEYRSRLDALSVAARFFYTAQHGLGVQPLNSRGVAAPKKGPVDAGQSQKEKLYSK